MDDDNENILSGQSEDELENSLEKSLRPQTLDAYIGQTKIKHELDVYIQAASGREEALDHVLLYGPPGLGKTTLAMVIANEMKVNIRTTSGPAIEKPGDLVALLNELEPGDVLFIDEIHRLPKIVEEMLYSAMEDFFVDIVVGQGPTAHPIHFPLPPFTLIGATTENPSFEVIGALLSRTRVLVLQPLTKDEIIDVEEAHPARAPSAGIDAVRQALAQKAAPALQMADPEPVKDFLPHYTSQIEGASGTEPAALILDEARDVLSADDHARLAEVFRAKWGE